MTKPVLVSRQAATPAAPDPAPTGAMELLEVELRRAQAIARAKEALPRSYRENVGAVMLADAWARSRGIDTLTAIQSVSFVDGKPVVDATMQRALAERAGFEVRVLTRPTPRPPSSSSGPASSSAGRRSPSRTPDGRG